MNLSTKGFLIQADKVTASRRVVSLCSFDNTYCIAMEKDGAVVAKAKPQTLDGFDATFKFEEVPATDDTSKA